jgi:glycerophosphoryl diester phosphodiesterase
MAVHPAVFTWLESRKRSSVEKRRGILAGMLCLVMVLALMSGISWKQQSSTNRQEDAVVSEADSAEADAQADAAAGEEADSAESDAQGNAAAGEETDTQADAAAGEEADTARIQLIGHRGYNALYPENTMPSFEAALNVGVDYIETDVQLTKDGRLVLFHDNTLEHITGAEGKIADYTYDELLELDFGTSFEVSFAGTQIAALEELLALVKDSGCRIYLELKDIGDVEGFAEAVFDMVEQYGMADRCVFASFRYEYLEQIKAIDPNVEILLNTTSDSTTLAEDFPAEYYGLCVGTMTQDTVNALHQAGRTVFVWTVNTPDAVRSVIDMGVDGIVTNEPEWTGTLLNRQE